MPLMTSVYDDQFVAVLYASTLASGTYIFVAVVPNDEDVEGGVSANTISVFNLAILVDRE